MQRIIFIPLLFLSFVVYGDITGKVTDTKGEPIPGVNIFWLNTQSGTVSDVDGTFKITGSNHS